MPVPLTCSMVSSVTCTWSCSVLHLLYTCSTCSICPTSPSPPTSRNVPSSFVTSPDASVCTTPLVFSPSSSYIFCRSATTSFFNSSWSKNERHFLRHLPHNSTVRLRPKSTTTTHTYNYLVMWRR